MKHELKHDLKHDLGKRSIAVSNRNTSMSVEPAFWEAFGELVERLGMTKRLMGLIIDKRISSNLSSQVRVFVLKSI
jgi:predicted DNA-binding ribbon-helix-helix protein